MAKGKNMSRLAIMAAAMGINVGKMFENVKLPREKDHSKYTRHQGNAEKARRLRQRQAGII